MSMQAINYVEVLYYAAFHEPPFVILNVARWTGPYVCGLYADTIIFAYVEKSDRLL